MSFKYNDDIDIIIEKGTITRINKDGSRETKVFDVSVAELEYQIGRAPYYLFADKKNEYWKEKFLKDEDIHMFLGVTIFYNFIFENGRFPTQWEFWKEYREKYADKITWSWHNGIHYMTVRGKTVTTKRFVAKILKSYPSYIRDYHMFVMMNNSPFYRDKFRYSISEDLDGIDLVINHNDTEYYFGLDVNTKNSLMCEDIKKNIRHADKLGTVHYMRLNFNEGKYIKGVSLIKNEQFIVYDFDKVDKWIRDIINGDKK